MPHEPAVSTHTTTRYTDASTLSRNYDVRAQRILVWFKIGFRFDCVYVMRGPHRFWSSSRLKDEALGVVHLR